MDKETKDFFDMLMKQLDTIPVEKLKEAYQTVKAAKQIIYQQNGYKDRDDYLTCLAEDYGVPIEDVYSLADMLGENEDFDGLVSALEDAECLL